MRKLLVAFFLLFTVCLHAQDTTHTQHDTIPPSFNGGRVEWLHFLQRNIVPQTPVDNGAKPGIYIVTISFLVDTMGHVSDVHVVHDPGFGTAADVLNAFSHTPNWIPATVDGKKVLYRQKQDFTYEVTDN